MDDNPKSTTPPADAEPAAQAPTPPLPIANRENYTAAMRREYLVRLAGGLGGYDKVETPQALIDRAEKIVDEILARYPIFP